MNEVCLRLSRGSRRIPLSVGAAALALALTGAQAANAAPSQSAAQAFYKGKVVTVIIPYGAAGGYEYWAAALKPFLEKTLGASRIDLVNKPGGGGYVGANYLYQAKPDGLTIGEINGAGGVFGQIVKKPGVYFDMTKFAWIGSPNVETTITVARAGDKYKTFADLWKLRGGKTKVVGLSAGYGGNDYVGTALPLSTFGIPFQMLLAYQGSSAAKAGLLRGDGDIATYGYSVFRPLIKSHNVVPLYIAGPKPFSLLPGVPTIVQLAAKYKLPKAKTQTIDIFARASNIGKDWAAPPGIAADRLAFLRSAFRKAAQDPGFLAAAKKAGRVAGYASASDLESIISAVVKNKDQFTPFLKH
ncbi:MAG TPA: tripartite tricarboxylate transporter substrate-binding protein [Beijerinckiaceae bacterium]|nr:tripartite tricarboxylate transporter substrate-binding protein [Beijerinckiaceae bacterium]